MSTLSKAAVEAVNKALALVGIALRLEFITPTSAQDQLKQNPARLQKYGLSQKMSGDGSENTVIDAKGRKFVKTLLARIAAGQWKWYMGVIARCENGAVIDGVTRLIAIAQSGVGVWAIVYEDAQPEDFFMYDGSESARCAEDIFANMGYPSQTASILAHIVPKAAGSDDGTGKHISVLRDSWYACFQKYKKFFLEAVDFVKTGKGDKAVSRKNSTALMYYRFVAQGGRSATRMEQLLTVYKTGFPEPGNKVERQMVELAAEFDNWGSMLHERIHCIPLFTRVLIAAARGDVLKYYVRESTSPYSGKKMLEVVYSKRPKRAKLKIMSKAA